MATDAKQIMRIKGAKPKGSITFRATASDWEHIMAVKHSYEKISGCVATVTEVIACCLELGAAALAGDEAVASGEADKPTAEPDNECIYCDGVPDGNAFQCNHCGRKLIADLVAIDLHRSGDADEIVAPIPHPSAAPIVHEPSTKSRKRKGK